MEYKVMIWDDFGDYLTLEDGNRPKVALLTVSERGQGCSLELNADTAKQLVYELQSFIKKWGQGL